MKKGISYWSLPGGLEGKANPIEAMKEARRKGFEAIELCVGRSGALTTAASEKKCREILKAAKDIGIEIIKDTSNLPPG